MNLLFLSSLLLIAFAASAAPVPKPSPFPVRWSKTVALDSFDNIGKALDAKVGDGEEMELVRDGVPHNVTTCTAYLKAKKDGFEAPNSLTMAQETWFRARCRTLELLRDARAAKRGFVRTLPLDEKLLQLLPPSFDGPLSSDELQAVASAEAAGKSWIDYNAGLVAKRVDAETLEVRDADKTWVHTLHVLANGDFDADGDDDLLVAVTEAADTGSFRRQSLVVLTRDADDKKLRVARTLE